MARIENILLNFAGVYRDADGALMFGAKTVPVPEIPAPVIDLEAPLFIEPDTSPVKEPEVG